MYLKGFTGGFTPARAKQLERIMTWGTPALVIPALRFTIDSKKRPEMSKELFVRDFTTYSIGSSLFFIGSYVGDKLFSAMKVFKEPYKKNFASFLIGLAGYLLYSGIGALYVSEALSKKKKPVNVDMKNDLQNVLSKINPVKTNIAINQSVNPFSAFYA